MCKQNIRKSILYSILGMLFLASTPAFSQVLTITNQTTDRTMIVNGSTIVLDSGMTFTSRNGSTFRGTIDVILDRPGGALNEVLTCTFAKNGFSHNGPRNVSSGSTASTTLTLTFSVATANINVQNALQAVTYRAFGSSINTQKRYIWFMVKEDPAFNTEAYVHADTMTHYYQYSGSAVTWTTAQANAIASYYYGMRGYLATLTSAGETSKIVAINNSTGWIGGSDDWNGASSDGTWKWANGPESKAANGGTFPRSGSAYTLDYAYSNWGASEPNGATAENKLEFLGGGTGQWNDFADANLLGYHTEYGGERALLTDKNYIGINVFGNNSLQPAAGF